MPNRLEIGPPRLIPVQALFNAIPDHVFIERIEALLAGRDVHIDDTHCEFPSEEDRFDGVRFVLLNEEIVVSRADFRRYLQRACEAQAGRLPDQGPALDVLMSRL